MASVKKRQGNRPYAAVWQRRDGPLAEELRFDKAIERRYHKDHFILIESAENVVYS